MAVLGAQRLAVFILCLAGSLSTGTQGFRKRGPTVTAKTQPK